jgi:L-fuculose-phosphate aldolase
LQKTLFSLKRDIVHVGKRVYERGYVASNDGNISARIDDKRVVITPTGVSKGFMDPEDLVVVDYEGKILSGRKKPSSEVYMHLNIYKERPDVNSVCHAHPPHATGFAVAGLSLDQCVLPEVVVALGSIPLVEYGTPGTDEFYTPVLKYLGDHDAFLLANHGALTIGKDVLNAYHKMETLEHFAHIAFVAQQLGHTNVLNRDQVQKLYDLRQNFGISTGGVCKSCENEGTCEVPESSKGYTRTCGSEAAQEKNARSASTNGIDKEALIKQVTQTILAQLS